jgi:hypothetical protein
MVNISFMKVIRHIEKPVEKNMFLIETQLNIDPSYFIEKIEEGIKHEDNKNYITHVQAKMTSWHFFVQDYFFVQAAKTAMNYLDENIRVVKCNLEEAWGTKMEYNDRIKEHNHYGCIVSGVLFLQNSGQELYFKELNTSVKPKVGKLILFSSLLDHGTKFSVDNKPRYSIAFNYLEQHKNKWV